MSKPVAAHPEIIEARLNQVKGDAGGRLRRCLPRLCRDGDEPWLHEIAVPALVPTGEHDVSCDPHRNRQMAAALPKGELVILGGPKHAIPIEAADRVGPHLARFLSRHS